jgi:hypothetical protein
LKISGEGRVEMLKGDLAAREFGQGVILREAGSSKDKLNILSDMQQTLRHKKEVCEALEELEQKIDRGFDHLSELLGVTLREKGAQITDVIMDVETVLDTLMEEREKQTQAQVVGGPSDSLSQQGSRIQSPGTTIVSLQFILFCTDSILFLFKIGARDSQPSCRVRILANKI